MQGPDEMRAALRSVLTSNMATETVGSTVSALQGMQAGGPSAVIATVAFTATIDALRLGYASIEAHAQASQDAYSMFVQDYNAGTVSVFLPNDETIRSQREHFFANFLDLLKNGEAGNQLFRNAGIRFTENVEMSYTNALGFKYKRVGRTYSLISLPTLVFAGGSEYARSGDPLLDIALRGSDLFLRAKLNHTLAAIFSYNSPNILVSAAEHSWTTRKLSPEVIQELDLVRFMIMVFANLLTNAQHPSNLDTNIPLSSEEAISFCTHQIALINQLLLVKKKDKKLSYLYEIYCKDVFTDFIRKAKREAEELQEGYQSKKLNQLNLVDVIAQSHGILQQLCTLWHRILYLDKPMTESIQLLALVRYLSNALDDHPNFWTQLTACYVKKKWTIPDIQGLNHPFRTVIDLIGLFASLPSKQRKSMLQVIQKDIAAPAIYEALFQLNSYFIETLAEDLQPLAERPAQSYLMNLIALSFESHPALLQEAVVPTPGVPTLKQQFAVFNDAQIMENDQRTVFTWDLVSSLCNQAAQASASARRSQEGKLAHFLPKTVEDLRALLHAKYQFLIALRNLYILQDKVENNRILLLHKNVRNTLKKVLATLAAKENGLSMALQTVMDQITNTDKIDDTEKDDISNQRRLFILQLRLSNPDWAAHLRHEIDAAIAILNSPVFLNREEAKLTDDLTTVYGSHEEFLKAQEELFAALQIPVVRRPPSEAVSAPGGGVSTGQPEDDTLSVSTHDHDHAPKEGHLTESRDDSAISNASLQLQLMLRILRLVGTFLLIVGILVLVSLTMGASYLPVIAALSPQQFAVGMTIGGMTALIGGASVGLACFFKPAVPQEAGASPANNNSLVA